MMKQAQTLPQKSLIVKKRFISLIENLEENEILNDIYSRDALDALERFALWAGSLGALREPNSQLSIEYRLAEAPDIRIEIHRQLDYLLEAIDDGMLEIARLTNTSNVPSVATIVQKRQANYELQEDDKDMEHFDSFVDIQSEPSEEIRTNLELISESLRMLFRIAVLVRKANPDNRFERAIHSSKCTFPPTFDIEHVREKHPKIKAKEQSWLAERLGKAIARRRQFIKYCRDRKDRLALDDENIEAKSATTVMQSSKATTLDPKEIHAATNFAVGDYEDEVVSILSISTATYVLSTFRLPRLADLSRNGEAFECPICFTLRSIKGERSWRLHVFHDLRPYSCTVGGLIMNAHCATFPWPVFGTSTASHGRCWKKSSALQTKDKSKTQDIEGKSVLVCTSSTIANLSELGVQEEPQTSGEEWLEGRLTDDEDLPNTDEEQHNALLKTLDYLKIISEASSNGNFEKPPPTEALDQGIIPPILKEPTPPPLSDLEKEHWNKDLVEFMTNEKISLGSERLKDEISNTLKAEKDRRRQYAEIMAQSEETVRLELQAAEIRKRRENEDHILHLIEYAAETVRVKMIGERVDRLMETLTREDNERKSRNQGN
ncbi:hypothetical protein THAR02_05402 [Trichoderma harzianum]|uniref:Oxidoreductase acuF-like C2H2 type zinc-finger domain-containing protein n=1 Tax=Trichoderma harzianum TaxID=5544 RepID=A0A0F9XQH9_TRIHA|nr:hypothetical protein THAR02_05402 [Trichoderma harzianum]